MSKDNTPIYECPDVIEMVIECLGRRYKKSQIKEKLREIIPNLSRQVCEKVIAAAKKQIRDNYKIEPTEYRGYLVEELERLLRNDKTPTKYRLKVIHELSTILGLDHITGTDDPMAQAEKVRAAVAAMDESIGGIPASTEEDKDNGSSNISTPETPTPQQETASPSTQE